MEGRILPYRPGCFKEQGYEVVGLFMKDWEDDDDSEYCSARQDWLDAVTVADVIGIDIEVVNFAAEYKDRVFRSSFGSMKQGELPIRMSCAMRKSNSRHFSIMPCLWGPNRLLPDIMPVVRENDGRFESLKAVDDTKDQSYFLHRLNQKQLSRTIFPLGEIRKTEVRKIAEKIGLPNARKKDSTGICFIGERPFRAFLNRYLSYEPGPIKTPDGQVIGQHVGLSFYTIGQRKGIGIGGMKSFRKPDGTSDAWYVARKDIPNNTLYVVQGHDHPWLLSPSLEAGQPSWISGDSPEDRELSVKTRYRQKDIPCLLTVRDASAFSASFVEPQWAITPGQSAVFYKGEVCLGGGIIDNASPVA